MQDNEQAPDAAMDYFINGCHKMTPLISMSIPERLIKKPCWQKFSRLTRGALGGVLLPLLLAAGGVQADELRLLVNLEAVRDVAGELRVSLYRDPETFRKEDRALKVISIAAAKGDVQVIFDKLESGCYVIMVFYDENGDGKLNLRFGMFPTEGYGLSNNPTIIGPPKFADSALEVIGPQTATTIRLSY